MGTSPLGGIQWRGGVSVPLFIEHPLGSLSIIEVVCIAVSLVVSRCRQNAGVLEVREGSVTVTVTVLGKTKIYLNNCDFCTDTAPVIASVQ